MSSLFMRRTAAMTRLVLEVSQAKSDRPIKALENTSPLAFTQIEEAS